MYTDDVKMIPQKNFTLKKMKKGQMRTFSPKNRTFSKKQDKLSNKLSKNIKNMKNRTSGTPVPVQN